MLLWWSRRRHQSIVQRDDGGYKDGVAKSCCSPAGVSSVALHALGLCAFTLSITIREIGDALEI